MAAEPTPAATTVPATPVELLAARGVSFAVHEHPGSADPAEVCAALGVALAETVKTLAFETADGHLVLAAFPGHARLKYGALARAAGVRRAELAPAGVARPAALGMAPGGVCPVSADGAAVVVFDAAVAHMGTVHCGSGRPDRTIEVAAGELAAAVPGARWAEIAAG